MFTEKTNEGASEKVETQKVIWQILVMKSNYMNRQETILRLAINLLLPNSSLYISLISFMINCFLFPTLFVWERFMLYNCWTNFNLYTTICCWKSNILLTIYIIKSTFWWVVIDTLRLQLANSTINKSKYKTLTYSCIVEWNLS